MNRLRDLREDKDLLQKDIAKILNMSQTACFGLEKGVQNHKNSIMFCFYINIF